MRLKNRIESEALALVTFHGWSWPEIHSMALSRLAKVFKLFEKVNGNE